MPTTFANIKDAFDHVTLRLVISRVAKGKMNVIAFRFRMAVVMLACLANFFVVVLTEACHVVRCYVSVFFRLLPTFDEPKPYFC